jgi:HSP20 family molecular chaperone IbpA
MRLEHKNILSDFIRPIDLLNTINGGVAMTTMKLNEIENGFVLHVTAPTVEAEAFNVFIDNNKLIVFSELPEALNDMSGPYPVRIPMFHHAFDIPTFVSIEQIEAVYEEGELKVFLPFKDGSKAHRKIDIEEL